MAEARLARIFAIALGPPATQPAAGALPVVVLTELAQELSEAAGPGGRPAALTASTLDRALVTRLIEAPPADYPQPPVPYLLGCYQRASDELRGAGANQEVQAAVHAARDLILNYVGLALFAGVVPQPPALEARGALQLLDALLLSHGLPAPALATAVGPALGNGATAYAAAAVAMPAGFLEQLVVRHTNDEGLADAATRMVVELSRLVSRISPLGDPAPHLAALAQLVSLEPLAVAAVGCRQWLPADMRAATGRAVVLPGACWLGPFFNISPIADDVLGAAPQEPPVAASCFSRLEQRRPGDVASAVSGLRMAMRGVTSQLHGVVQTLLKTRSTRAPMVRWLAAVLEGNAARSKMVIEPEKLAPDGFLANVAAVLLKLCGPFLDPTSDLFWRRVDPSFVAVGGLLDASYAGETRLAADSEEESVWRERLRSNAAASASDQPGSPTAAGGDGPHHFICQAFFLTAHALHLGPVRSLTLMAEDVGRDISMLQSHIAQLEEALPSATNPAERGMMQLQLQRCRDEYDKSMSRYQALSTVLLDPALVAEVLAFYRLMAAWLTRLASGGAAASALSLPLAEPAPPEFTCLPEYFLEDMCSTLLVVSRVAPALLAGVRLDEFCVVFTALMASPKHVRSAYLRSRLSEVLEAWLPQEDDEPGRGGFRRKAGPTAELASLFSCHPLVVSHLAPVLVRLYNDIEHTERAGAFYFKFQMRVSISAILKYLWAQPQHRAVWLAAVRAEEYRGASERFANMLINDATYLLDEVLKNLKLLRQAEEVRDDEARWASMQQQERQELLRNQQHNGQQLTALLRSATSTIDTLCFITEEVDTTRTFLLPHLVGRLADSLNYFLKYLVGPERRQLRVRNPDKYKFNPRELLRGLLTVYLHADAVDRGAPGPAGPVFAEAVGRDARSFQPENFMEACNVLEACGMLSVPQRLAVEALAQRALAASSSAEAEDDMAEDAPDDFLCAIMATVMKDPVLLPSGKVVDRPNIQRHLLSDPTDPFTRRPLDEAQLVADAGLAARIAAWRAARRGGGAGTGP